MTEKLIQEIMDEMDRFILDTEDLYDYFYNDYDGLSYYCDVENYLEHFFDDVLRQKQFTDFYFWNDEMENIEGESEDEKVYNAFELVFNEFYYHFCETVEYAYTSLLEIQNEDPYNV